MTPMQNSQVTGLSVPATLRWGSGRKTNIRVFIDSGAAGNFVDQTLSNQLGLPYEVLPHSISVAALDER